MKVRMTLSVSEFERFVIAKYYGPIAEKKRTRATRREVATFARAALRAAAIEHVHVLRGKSRAAVNRLRDGAPAAQVEELKRPDEVQRALF